MFTVGVNFKVFMRNNNNKPLGQLKKNSDVFRRYKFVYAKFEKETVSYTGINT